MRSPIRIRVWKSSTSTKEEVVMSVTKHNNTTTAVDINTKHLEALATKHNTLVLRGWTMRPFMAPYCIGYSLHPPKDFSLT